MTQDEYWANLRLLAGSPRVFVKLSEIPVRVNGKLMTDPHFYQASLDALWDIFGEDHVLFGSDWPNSDHVATYAQTFAIVREYMARKSAASTGEVLLEELGCGLQMGAERPRASASALNEYGQSKSLIQMERTVSRLCRRIARAFENEVMAVAWNLFYERSRHGFSRHGVGRCNRARNEAAGAFPDDACSWSRFLTAQISDLPSRHCKHR